MHECMNCYIHGSKNINIFFFIAIHEFGQNIKIASGRSVDDLEPAGKC